MYHRDIVLPKNGDRWYHHRFAHEASQWLWVMDAGVRLQECVVLPCSRHVLSFTSLGSPLPLCQNPEISINRRAGILIKHYIHYTLHYHNVQRCRNNCSNVTIFNYISNNILYWPKFSVNPNWETYPECINTSKEYSKSWIIPDFPTCFNMEKDTPGVSPYLQYPKWNFCTYVSNPKYCLFLNNGGIYEFI